ARLPHGDKQIGDGLMTRCRRLGAAENETPIGPLSERGPYLLPVDHPLVALALGPGLHVRQLGAGVRLGEPLAPELLALDDRRQEAALLLRRAERHHRGSEQGLADVSEPPRAASARVLFVEDDLLHQRQAAAPVFLGPADAGP